MMDYKSQTSPESDRHKSSETLFLPFSCLIQMMGDKFQGERASAPGPFSSKASWCIMGTGIHFSVLF